MHLQIRGAGIEHVTPVLFIRITLAILSISGITPDEEDTLTMKTRRSKKNFLIIYIFFR